VYCIHCLLSVQCTGEKQQAINHVEKLFEESKELVCIFFTFFTIYADK